MALMYPEKGSAETRRTFDVPNQEVFVVRSMTKIIFGDSKKVIAKVIMTNPGSFGFHQHPYWNEFKSYMSTYKRLFKKSPNY